MQGVRGREGEGAGGRGNGAGGWGPLGKGDRECLWGRLLSRVIFYTCRLNACVFVCLFFFNIA